MDSREFKYRTDEIIKKLDDLTLLANKKYKINLPFITLKLNLKGRSAGQAKYKYNRLTGTTTDHVIRLNADMIKGSGYEHILNDTIPHELAHIICGFTGWGNNHDSTWKSICKALGGSGERCHNEEVIPARKTDKFQYHTTCGRVVKVGKIRHNKIQNGISYRVNSGGVLIKDSWQLLTA